MGSIKITDEQLKQIQKIELEILEEVDRICKKCGIKYCISAGTQLGAIRHKGFIPWDDDVDIGLLRNEYEKFRKACKTELDSSRFYFQDHRNTSGYRWGYGKIRRKNTLFLREFQENMPYEQGICIDVMPYDNVPDNFLLRKFHSFRCFLYRKCFWSPVGQKQTKGLEKMVYKFMCRIPSKKLYDSYDKFTVKYNKKESKRIRNTSLPVPGKECGYLKKCYSEVVPTEFEGIELMGMKYYDAYLSYKYGDYMKLPPKNKREVHPVSNLKLL